MGTNNLYKKIEPSETTTKRRFYFEGDIVCYRGIRTVVVLGLKSGKIKPQDVPDVYDIDILPCMSNQDIGAGEGCGVTVQSNDIDLGGVYHVYPE